MGEKSSEQRLNLMAPDCQSPRCHEAVRLALEGKVSKRTLWVSLWAVFIAVLLPLVGTGIKVWSQQENSHLKYAEKKELIEIDKRQTELRTAVGNIKENVQDIKKNQEETQRDIKEILRHLRDNPVNGGRP